MRKVPVIANLLEQAGQYLLTPRGAVLYLVVMWLALVVSQLTPSFEMKRDSARYLALARSIQEGRGYTIEGRFCRSYPPIFPYMLSAVGSSNDEGYRLEKFIVAIAALGSLLGAYWLFAQRYQGRRLVILATLVAVSPALVRASTMLLSDVPFVFFTVLLMVAADYFWRSRKLSWRAGTSFSVTLAVAALTRSAGLVFYLASLVWLARPALWRQEFRRSIVFAALLIFVASPPALLWLTWTHTHREGGTPSYTDYIRSQTFKDDSPISPRGLRALAVAVARTVPQQLSAAAQAVFPIGGRAGGAITAVILVPVGLLGLLRRMRAPAPSDYLFWGYSLLILLWPGYQGPRLWLPVLPLMLGYLADGIDDFGYLTKRFPQVARWRWLARIDRLAGSCRSRVMWWGTALLLAFGILAGIGMIARSWIESREAIGGVILKGARLDVARFLTAPHTVPVVLAYSHFLEVAAAIRNEQGAVVGIPGAAEGDAQATLRELHLKGVTHLAVEQDSDVANELTRVVPRGFRLLCETPEVQIFEVLPLSGVNR